MDIISGFSLYVMIWWVVIFCFLPIGVTQAQDAEGAGTMPGAPARPQLKQKIIWTTIVTTILWVIIFSMVQSELFSFRDWAKSMTL